jgi:rhamnogalacturonan endolyase
MRHRTLTALVLLALGLLAMPAHGQRIMEKLGRGFVAVGGGTGNLLSWRLYGTEQGTDVAFNVYKGTTKLNATPITNSTNYQDTAGGTSDYTLKAIIGGVEEATGTKAMLLPKGYLEIPLKAAPGRNVKFGCVGDLDGDGEYEYVVDRQAVNISQYIDAYKRDGTFMWRIDMGPNSTNTSNSNPGPANVGFGHSDNEAVFDIDSDGKGEFLVKAANGTIFGDNKTLTAPNDTDAYIVAVDGVTGAEKGTRVLVPNDNPSLGNMTGHFGIAYFDGVHPSLMFKAKWGGTKAMADFAFDFNNNAWSLRWKALDNPINSYPNNHQIRCLDINGDGLDEFVNGGYARDGAGKLLWNMASQGVVHGDRWHIGKFDPTKPGLTGVAIEQNGPSFDAYEYDPATGKLLHTWGQNGGDLGRGDTGDIDPAKPGYEFWGGASLGIVSVVDYTQIATGIPPANFRIWWDGDLLSENLDGNQISKWAYPGMPSSAFGGATLAGMVPGGNRPPLYGDMFGDWREEVMYEQSGGAMLRIYSTAIPTDKRIYTLMHDPEYRNAMVEKGYTQSRFVDFYLGEGMTDPPRPNIRYPDGSGAAGAGGGGTTGAAGATGSGGITGAGGASGRGGSTGAGGAANGGSVASGGTASTGGSAATGGGGGRGGSMAGSGGNPGTGGTTVVVGTGGAGTVATGGTPASGGGAGTGGSTVRANGGTPATRGTTAVVPPTGGSAVVPAGGGSTSGGAGGALGGQSGTKPVAAAADSGCSCAIGASSGRASAGYLLAMLGVLGMALNRRRRRGNSRK